MVTAFNSHQCSSCLTPGPGVICVMQVESVVGFVRFKGFLNGFSCFLLSRKCNTSELLFDLIPTYFLLFIFLKKFCILYTSWQKKQAIQHCIRWSCICNNKDITTCMLSANAENWSQMVDLMKLTWYQRIRILPESGLCWSLQ